MREDPLTLCLGPPPTFRHATFTRQASGGVPWAVSPS